MDLIKSLLMLHFFSVVMTDMDLIRTVFLSTECIAMDEQLLTMTAACLTSRTLLYLEWMRRGLTLLAEICLDTIPEAIMSASVVYTTISDSSDILKIAALDAVGDDVGEITVISNLKVTQRSMALLQSHLL